MLPLGETGRRRIFASPTTSMSQLCVHAYTRLMRRSGVTPGPTSKPSSTPRSWPCWAGPAAGTD